MVKADESRTLEVKKSTGELKEAMHAACAFLNTDGGWLIFGITPSSLKIVGQDVSDQTQREMSQALSYLEPAVDVRVEYIDVPNSSNQKIVAIHFDGWVWGKEPYTYRGCPYYKVESTTKVMPREMFEERLRASKPHKMSWERQIAEGFPVSNLNEKHIMDAVRLGVRGGRMPASAQSLSIEEILLRFSLMKDGQLLQAAIALFASDVQDYPQLLMRMARFKGNDKMEFVDSQQVRGDFFDMLDAGMAFCFKHLNIHGRIVGLRREETLNVGDDKDQETEQDGNLDYVIDKELNASSPAGSDVQTECAQPFADQRVEPLHTEDLILNKLAHQGNLPFIESFNYFYILVLDQADAAYVGSTGAVRLMTDTVRFILKHLPKCLMHCD